MNKPLLGAALLAALVVSLATPSPSAAQGAGGIALVDLKYIFDNHARFKSMRETYRADIEQAQNEQKLVKQGIDKLVEQLKALKRGTQEYKELDGEVLDRQASFQADNAKQVKEFEERSAKMYYMVYREILDEIRLYSDGNGISLVMQFNGDEIDTNSPVGIQRELNKSVIYYNKSIDITPYILNSLNRRGGAPVGANTPRAGATGVPRKQ